MLQNVMPKRGEFFNLLASHADQPRLSVLMAK